MEESLILFNKKEEVALEYQQRIQKAQQLLEEQNIDALIVTSPPNFFYFSGTWLDSHERLQAIVIKKSGPPIMVIHEMAKEEIRNLSLFESIFWKDGEHSIEILNSNLPKSGIVSIDNQWPSQNLIQLMQLNPNIHFVESTNVIGKLRLYKDQLEIELLRKSGSIADDVMEKAIAFIEPGKTEIEVVNEIKRLFKTHNVETLSFPPIVGAGKNGAIPHHQADETIISEGDMVVIDLGGIKDHYCSDMTRTIVVGKKVSDEMKEIYNIVKLAQEEAVKAVKPGIPIKEIDKKARDIITKAGYGKQFTHRTGHGIGIEVHEEPFITNKNMQLLEEGMVISIEPGIYIDGKFGVRIENIVLVTKDGCESFNHYTRELICKC